MAPVLHDLVRPHILHLDLPYFQSFVPYSTDHLVVQADRVIQAVFGRNPLEVAENLAMGGVTAWYGIPQVKIQNTQIRSCRCTHKCDQSGLGSQVYW